MAGNLVVKKRRPINKREARSIKEGILQAHKIEMPIAAGKYEIGRTEGFDVLISKGHIIAIVMEELVHLFQVLDNLLQYQKVSGI